MKHKVLIVIDMQNDFVTGSLGQQAAIDLVEPLVSKISSFEGEVIFTKDTHDQNYLNSQEGKNLPVSHCIKGTSGHDLVPKLQEIADKLSCQIFEKNTFGSLKLGQYLLKMWEQGELESVEFSGVCTDICVISNALLIKAFIPECPLYVNKDLCAGLNLEKHAHALDVMASCQIKEI